MSSWLKYGGPPHLHRPWLRPNHRNYMSYILFWAIGSSLSASFPIHTAKYNGDVDEFDRFYRSMPVTIGFFITHIAALWIAIWIFEQRIRARLVVNNLNGNFSEKERMKLLLDLLLPYHDKTDEEDQTNDENADWRSVEGTVRYQAYQVQVEGKMVTMYIIQARYESYTQKRKDISRLPAWIRNGSTNWSLENARNHTGSVRFWVFKRDPSYALVNHNGADVDEDGTNGTDIYYKEDDNNRPLLLELSGYLIFLTIGLGVIYCAPRGLSRLIVSIIYFWMMIQLAYGCTLALRGYAADSVDSNKFLNTEDIAVQ